MASSLPYIRPRRLPKSTFPPPANGHRAISAVAALRECWHRIHDIERAEAIRKIVNLGVSRRRLAKELGFSEGLLRHLLKALEATAADLGLASRNLISTNELVRRAANRQPDEVIADFESAQSRLCHVAALASARLIHWLRDDAVRRASALLIIEEARQELCAAAEAGKLPTAPAPTGISAEEVVRRCRPEHQKSEPETTWYGRWACTWVFRLTQNADACWNALDEACDSILSEEKDWSFGSRTRLS